MLKAMRDKIEGTDRGEEWGKPVTTAFVQNIAEGDTSYTSTA